MNYPLGWKLVPLAPTDEMVAAADAAMVMPLRDRIARAIEAAPEPLAEDEQQ